MGAASSPCIHLESSRESCRYRCPAGTIRRGVDEIGNSGAGDRRRGVFFEHDPGSTVGSAGICRAPQKGLRRSEVEGREFRPLVLGLPPTVALVIASSPRRRAGHRAQNFLKHSLPEPSSCLHSAAVACDFGVIWMAKLLPSWQRTLQYA